VCRGKGKTAASKSHDADKTETAFCERRRNGNLDVRRAGTINRRPGQVAEVQDEADAAANRRSHRGSGHEEQLFVKRHTNVRRRSTFPRLIQEPGESQNGGTGHRAKLQAVLRGIAFDAIDPLDIYLCDLEIAALASQAEATGPEHVYVPLDGDAI